MKSVIYFENDQVQISSKKVDRIKEGLEPGIYKAKTGMYGKLKLKKIKFKEVLKPVLTEEAKLVMDTIDKFYCPLNKKRINDCGFIHKLGVLLFGQQGTGKTSVFKFIINKAVKEKNAICFNITNGNSLHAANEVINDLRKIQDNPIIILIDELESFISDLESSIKNLLDGSESEDNFLVLAATNHINAIPKALKDRPSRFKVVLEYKGIQEVSQMMHVAKNMLKGNVDLVMEEKLYQAFEEMNVATIDEIKHIVQDLIMDTKFTIQKKKIGF